jgi:hypothetical protein
MNQCITAAPSPRKVRRAPDESKQKELFAGSMPKADRSRLRAFEDKGLRTQIFIDVCCDLIQNVLLQFFHP